MAEPLGADFYIGLPADSEANSRVVPLISPPPADLNEIGLPKLGIKTLSNPPITGDVTAQEWWRRAEIPAANGQGNARSVATVQSIVASGGEARGTRLLSEHGVTELFREQSNGPDLVLGVRPEQVHLTEAGGLRGEVFGTEYLGTTQIVTVTTRLGPVKARHLKDAKSREAALLAKWGAPPTASNVTRIPIKAAA